MEATENSYPELLSLADQDLFAVSAPFQDLSAGERDYLKDLYASFPKLEKELKRTGVTRHLLWQEYKRAHRERLSYTRFCEHFRRYCRLPRC